MDDIFYVTIFLIVVFIAYTKYKQHTTEQAIINRWNLIKLINNTIQDSNYDKETKMLLLNLPANSLNQSIIHNIFYDIVVSCCTKKNKQLSEKTLDTSDPKIKAIVFEVFKTNLLLLPHWYIFYGVLIMLYLLVSSIFTKTTNFLNNNLIEKLPKSFFAMKIKHLEICNIFL